MRNGTHPTCRGFVLHPLHFDLSKSAADCSEICKAKMELQVLVIECISASLRKYTNPPNVLPIQCV